MPATLELLPSVSPAAPVPAAVGRWRATTTLLGQRCRLEADRPVPDGVVDRLVAHLDAQWDVRRAGSDLGRLSDRPWVVVPVSPLTLLLVEHAVAAVDLGRRAGLDPGSCDATLDRRHGRVGLDPTVAAVAVRLAPAAAVDLLAELCTDRGARTGQVEVGPVRRRLDDPLPAWLRRAADDVTQVWERQSGCRALAPAAGDSQRAHRDAPGRSHPTRTA